jgi:hypothetical protein
MGHPLDRAIRLEQLSTLELDGSPDPEHAFVELRRHRSAG